MCYHETVPDKWFKIKELGKVKTAQKAVLKTLAKLRLNNWSFDFSVSFIILHQMCPYSLSIILRDSRA